LATTKTRAFVARVFVGQALRILTVVPGYYIFDAITAHLSRRKIRTIDSKIRIYTN
jgi:hypothetical protein